MLNHFSNDEVQVPVELKKQGSNLLVVSFILPRNYFRDPFFIDTLCKFPNIVKSGKKTLKEDKLLVRPIHYIKKNDKVVYTPIDEFIKKNFKKTVNKKLGFIFHMSRCGSTLFTKMLSSSNRFFVLSEPTIINSVLDPALDIAHSKREKLLYSSIHALASCSPRTCEKVFIKFRSWNVLFIDLILKFFPDVKWLFIHRNGLEILSSVLNKPPGWLRGRDLYSQYFSQVLNTDKDNIRSLSDDEYSIRLLGTFCRSARKAISKNGSFLDYKNLKTSFIKTVKKVWGINFTKSENKKIINSSKIHAKDISKTLKFKSDSSIKRVMATQKQKQLNTRYVETERKFFRISD